MHAFRCTLLLLEIILPFPAVLAALYAFIPEVHKPMPVWIALAVLWFTVAIFILSFLLYGLKLAGANWKWMLSPKRST